MTLETILVRLFEMATIIVFLLLAMLIGALLWVLNIGLYFFGTFISPTLAVITFTVSGCLNAIGWTLWQTLEALMDFGYKLFH